MRRASRIKGFVKLELIIEALGQLAYKHVLLRKLRLHDTDLLQEWLLMYWMRRTLFYDVFHDSP